MQISWNPCGTGSIELIEERSRGIAGEKKEAKSWQLGERFPRVLRACAIQFIWTGDLEVGRHGSTASLRFASFSRAISSATSGRSSSRFSRSCISIDRSIARSMPVRLRRGTSDLSRRVESYSRISPGSSIENCTGSRLNREEIQQTIPFFILASFQSIVWGVLVISLWGYRSVSRSRYVHQFYLHAWVDQMSCTDVFNRFFRGSFR